MINRILIALIVAHFLTAGYAILWLLPGDTPSVRVNYFIDGSIMPAGMEMAWYYKFIADQVLNTVTYSCFAVVAWRFSRKLFYGVAILNVYHYLDFVMFLYNFNQSWWFYIACGVLVLMLLWLLFKKIKEPCKVVSLQ